MTENSVPKVESAPPVAVVFTVGLDEQDAIRTALAGAFKTRLEEAKQWRFGCLHFMSDCDVFAVEISAKVLRKVET